MTNLVSSDIEQLINGYLSVYLNPRTINTDFGNQAVFLQKYAEHLECHSLNIYHHLLFKIGHSFEINEIISRFFNELNSNYQNRVDDIDDIINSLLTIFYLSYEGFCHPSNFIHQKAFAFFQLSFNYKNNIDNDKMRSYYIRSLFYNAHFGDNSHLFKLQDGILYFKNISIKNELVKLLGYPLSFVAKTVIHYCLLMIGFMENGLENPLKIDDEFYTLSHYAYFLSKDKKPYHLKNDIEHLNTLYCPPKTTSGDFINKQFLLNFMLNNHQAAFYIKKYTQNETVLKNIFNDMNDLEGFYILRKKVRQSTKA